MYATGRKAEGVVDEGPPGVTELLLPIAHEHVIVANVTPFNCNKLLSAPPQLY
jgi:hypothetical protein